jgi:putative transposase
LGLSGPVPARVPAEVKEAVLKTVDDAVAAGFAHTWACSLWQVSDSRVHRWRARRRDTGTLVDQAPGGHPVHTLLSDEVAAVLQVAERWGPVDRSHRKLPTAAPTSSWCGCRRPRFAACSSRTG